jgi:hypothetical protein
MTGGFRTWSVETASVQRRQCRVWELLRENSRIWTRNRFLGHALALYRTPGLWTVLFLLKEKWPLRKWGRGSVILKLMLLATK